GEGRGAPGWGRSPGRAPAEADEADPVLPLEVEVRECRGSANGAVVRAPPVRAHLSERVEEEDDVGVALGGLLVDREPPAQPARAPVDAPDPVPGLPRAEIRELDPLAAHARHLIAREDLGLERRHEGAKRLFARIDAQVLRFSHVRLPGAEPENVAGANQQRADRERSPALAA